MSGPKLDYEDDDMPEGTLFGRYSIVGRIAMGGMAAVYEARHVDLQKPVAVKVLRRSLARDPVFVQRFVLEARASARLRHPNVIAVSDVGVEHDRPFMVMDLLDGEDLRVKLERDGPLPLDRLADLMLAIVSAVAAAHGEGILHRDLKPENIFIARDRWKREQPVLLDFGISRPLAAIDHGHDEKRALTRRGETLGTLEYMAPEQLFPGDPLDARCDQYALGVILYECATLVHPFRGDSFASVATAIMKGDAPPPSSLRPGLPKELDALVARAMSLGREKRFESVRDLGRALWRFATPLAQAVWEEELGPRPENARISQPAAPPRTHEEVVVRPADLRVFPDLDECSDEELEELIRSTRARRFADGARILTQGAHGSGCFLLISGEVRIVKATAAGLWVVGTQFAGSSFGQIALVDNLPRTASVVAAGPVVVLQIDRSAYERLLRATNGVARRLAEQIAVSAIRQLRRATKRLTALMNRSTPFRSGTDPRRELVYLQIAAHEWRLPIRDDEEEPSPT